MTGRKVLPVLSLFTSMSTLVCCALPALLVALGMGAVLAGFLTQVPQLIWMSENKLLFLGAGGLMLLVAGIAQYRARRLPCPIDPEEARNCSSTRSWSGIIYKISIALYGVGVFFSSGVLI